MYITEAVTILELFNCQRFSDQKHPSSLYRYSKKALDFFTVDRIQRLRPWTCSSLGHTNSSDLPMISNSKCQRPANGSGINLAEQKLAHERAGSPSNRDTKLPFSGKTMNYHVTNGWLFPLLAAFRANLRWDLKSAFSEWRVPLQELLPKVIDAIVGVCVQARKGEGLEPDELGMRDHIYSQCYDKVQLQLAKLNKLT